MTVLASPHTTRQRYVDARALLTHTHLEIIDKKRDREAAGDDSNSEQDVLQSAHIRATAMFIFDLFFSIGGLHDVAHMENFVETVAAWVNL